ncbi:MAG: cohesin domain-containing protein, partial [Dehalococcoidia bacterium]
MKRKLVSQSLAAILVLSLLLVSMPAVADSGLTSGFAKIKDWDKSHEAFSFSSGQVAWGSGDFFISPRGIHVFESPGIIDMGLIYLDDVGEAPATGYVELAAPIDGHTYVVRSNGKYGKFYLEETYDWLDPIEYGISWVYQPDGTRSLGGSASAGQTVTSGQTGTAAATGCTYAEYIAAYNKLTSLMSQGKGDTPEAQAAYAEYAKVKACYESGSTGTGQSSTSTSASTSTSSGTSSGTYTIPTTTTPATIPPTSTSPSSTPVTLHLTCENKDNEEKACGPFAGMHTYLFGSQYVTSVIVRFDTGRRFDCRSAVSLQVYRNGAWQTIETINAVSSSGNSEFAPLQVQVPVNDTIAGFRISDGCVCCIDFSEITIYGSQSLPQSSTTTTTSSVPASTPTPAPTPTTPTSTTATTSIPAGTALIAESRNVTTGGTVQVPIYFQDAQNVGSLGFTLSYDPAVVQVVKVSKGSLLSPATFTSSDQSGSIIFGFASPQAISGNGSAAIVEFRALGSAGSTSALTLSEILATSYYGSSLTVSPVNGLLTIGQNQPGDADGDGKLSVLDA